MRALTYVYDSDDAPEHVEAVLDRLDAREESVERLDVAAYRDRADALREATLAVKEGVGIGTTPDALFDAGGDPDFSAGALITEAATGRRSLHVGEAALEALEEE
ncbi:MAG: hypothetical protein ABEH66_08005 [Halobacteriales archaeon]